MSFKVSAAVLTVVGAALLSTGATAAPLAPAQNVPAANQQLPIETVQSYYHRSHRYCFYLDGWHGPGWYRCGYHHRKGYGWGGPSGWNKWSHNQGHRRVYRAPVQRHYVQPRREHYAPPKRRYIERH